MRIGELAQRAGVTPRTIRYYKSLGLLNPNERSTSQLPADAVKHPAVTRSVNTD